MSDVTVTQILLLLLVVFIGSFIGPMLLVIPSGISSYRIGREQGYTRRQSLARLVTG
jgi:hypothetical protein